MLAMPISSSKPSKQQPPPPQMQPPPNQIPPNPMYTAPPPAQMPPTQGVPPMMITEDDIRILQSNTSLFRIEKSSAPSSLSSKSLFTLIRPSGIPLGSIHFHSMESGIDLALDGGQTKLKSDGTMHWRWAFQPTTFPNIKWWFRETKGGDLRLADDKDKDGGQTIAIVSGNVLMIEQIGLNERAIDEVVLATVAIKEKRRRDKRTGEAADGIGQVIGAFGGGGA